MHNTKVDLARKARLMAVQDEYSNIMSGQLPEQVAQLLSNSKFSSEQKKFIEDKYNQIKAIVEQHRKQIDALIKKYSKERPFDQLNPIDIAILRVAIAEGFIGRLVPVKVAINEAVRIAKRYSTANAYKFINGVLGNILRKEKAFKDLT